MSDLFSGKPHTVHITKKNRIQIQSKKKQSLFFMISLRTGIALSSPTSPDAIAQLYRCSKSVVFVIILYNLSDIPFLSLAM